MTTTPTLIRSAAGIDLWQTADGFAVYADSDLVIADVDEETARATARRIWHERCDAITVPASEPAPVTEPGIYRREGTFFKVQPNKARTRFYAKRLEIHRHDGEAAHVAFVYEAGAIYRLTADMRLTAEQAREFGIDTGACCWCGTAVGYAEDQRSAYCGYGPVCAKANGWWFPTVAEFRRIMEEKGVSA